MDTGASHSAKFLARWACGLALLLLPARLGSAEVIREVGAVEIRSPGAHAGQHPVFSPAQLESRLRSFVGHPCEPQRIAESIARIYRFLGYVPSIEASCSDGRLSLSVRESNQTIELIAFDESELSVLGIGRDSDYQEARGLYPVTRKALRPALRGLLQTTEGDLYNSERYRNESDLLRRFGYAIAVIPGASRSPEELPRSAYLVESLMPGGGSVDGSRRKSNYIGGTASYGPRIGASFGVRYEKDSLFLPLDRLSIAPAYNAAAGGELSYLAP
ncbi:MAG TPA: hypothetical protein VGR38_05215, partial [Candidatus Polarisedimenticolia bacterium]|nr:hypothetical protein [Candidatus Polarisedimenticolia bacterium]